MTSSDVSTRESSQLAVASTTLGPWRTAGAVGVVGGGAALAVDLITLHWSLSVLAGPAGIALFLFFLVGGVGSVVGRKGDRRLRRWAAEHPWETALVPAVGLAVTNTLTQFFLSGSGVFASIFTGLWHAAVLGVVIGVVGSVTASRRSQN
ncbi:hypothetical protein [Streptacidiphilus sp. P02-A3a]|uniref:hypothetical protein n=1 Tax=Streptacidiphilus sp. P02-A3a TaxID=2704468 RepID=UPI0015F9519E|nr:hypothetical protein [Streptacidiphilus sp. P02-A3a]QMU72971.1 hypothetical protein GXP74_36755 [Streptacidiphilus sp. P02-A3a]